MTTFMDIFFFQGAITSGAKALEHASDEYYTGMLDTYAALEKVLREYEEGLNREQLNSEKGGLDA